MRPLLIALAGIFLLIFGAVQAQAQNYGFQVGPGETLMSVNGVPVAQNTCTGPNCGVVRSRAIVRTYTPVYTPSVAVSTTTTRTRTSEPRQRLLPNLGRSRGFWIR